MSTLLCARASPALAHRAATLLLPPTLRAALLHSFYGLMVNAQLSAYAFKTAFARIHQMSKLFTVPAGEYQFKRARWMTRLKSKGAYTSQARLHYCAGLVAGLRVAVDEAKERRRRRREVRMQRWQATVLKLEGAASGASISPAVEEGLPHYGCADNDNSNGHSLWDAGFDSSSDSDARGAAAEEEGGDSCAAYSAVKSENAALVAEAKLEKIKAKIAKARREDNLTSSIIVHTESVEQAALKKYGVGKLTKGARRKPLKEWNSDAYAKGEKDAKTIDLDRRSIGAG